MCARRQEQRLFIEPNATTTFTFWSWITNPHGNSGNFHYLDVTPWPVGRYVAEDGKHTIVPAVATLAQIAKMWNFDPGKGRWTLFLTLMNEEDFPVAFTANHLLVYPRP